ncbi:methylated-DNA--[protein]-cysteine S-methyltransferase [Chitinophaga barathri]|uniref:methylated-DNA--[protein]-cysteine S-methyltransferase n=1 Tax=Chitinophaga barathri TaxID=1647451 RepID=A0A3N4MDP7_9BACT|nr:methylated-DNA--[protein]-cysteine S-methyltransferase [Chitinophaga barathri]RPD39727.1 methylated-DNA--[protein]-cysteine S-methyltransferase [Chitinophaga barathri]
MHHYEKIAAAIAYIYANHTEQPSLDDIAAAVHLSPYHFQRLFTEWAGVSPKKFLQYISLQHAKGLLAKDYTVEQATFETGLSGTSRLHDMFVNLEAMTPGEYRNGGEALSIRYTFIDTVFGPMLAAATDKGICSIAFADNRTAALEDLRLQWPNASFKEEDSPFTDDVKEYFGEIKTDIQEDQVRGAKQATKAKNEKAIRLHVKATPFQLKVWEALLKVPAGEVATYSRIAQQIDHPKAARAVGTAVGDNPVAYLIPCHRVIKSTGIFGGYHWGPVRKTAILGWESAKNQAVALSTAEE